jgi:hypothetical protein
MKTARDIGAAPVQDVYAGPEGQLWELLMGEQVHMGGFASSLELADQAGIAAGTSGVDLCCGTGAGMRFLVRCRQVAPMRRRQRHRRRGQARQAAPPACG